MISTDEHAAIFEKYLRELRMSLCLQGLSACIVGIDVGTDEAWFRSFLWPSLAERFEMGDCDE